MSIFVLLSSTRDLVFHLLLDLTAGLDPLLARHFAHLFIRDPLVVYRDLLEQDDATSSLHFEVPVLPAPLLLPPSHCLSTHPLCPFLRPPPLCTFSLFFHILPPF